MTPVDVRYRVPLVRVFSPKSITGLKLWLDALKIAGLADGDPVTTWSDLSGNGNDVTQATAAKKPLYKVNILNGRPVVRFDGTDDWLSAGDVTFLDALTGLTCFAVAKVASGNGVVVGKTSASEAFGLYLRSTIPSIFLARTSVSAYCDANAAQTAGTWYVLTCWYDGANLFLRVSGDLQTDQPALTGGILDSADQFALGAEVASASTSQTHLNGDIAEVLLYNRALSAAERQSVERHFSSKYAITIS